ncbi:hypothetical protein [Trichlorobacter ammonificans]|uniref:Flagellar motor switch protein FliG n=1 Tax=Trichlorobacter ammonificans TaxID=2916410 RepID=A0ABM9DBL6_9BACT|nr:hypothetical protein [Trichlorobacter ammonificans]CAH2032621.1 Flagellar motor switch protein FliG [Trichlorobacter ammonificans]
MDYRTVAKALLHEHPQIVAVALSRLPSEQAGEILKLLPSFVQADLLQRISQTEELPQEIVEEIDAMLAGIIRNHG